MDNKNINIVNEAGNIADKLDLFKSHERMSIIESDVEYLVKKFRTALNNEIVTNLNEKLRKEEAVACSEGHSLYRYEDKKKNSLLHTKNL